MYTTNDGSAWMTVLGVDGVDDMDAPRELTLPLSLPSECHSNDRRNPCDVCGVGIALV